MEDVGGYLKNVGAEQRGQVSSLLAGEDMPRDQ